MIPNQPLNTSLARQITDALLVAFPLLTDWEQLLAFGLGINLSTITLGQDLRTFAFAVLRWSEATGQTDALLRAAQAQNPGSLALQTVITVWNQQSGARNLIAGPVAAAQQSSSTGTPAPAPPTRIGQPMTELAFSAPLPTPIQAAPEVIDSSNASRLHRLRILSGHTGSVKHLIFSPDSAWLASGAADGTIRLWRSSTGECAQILRAGPGAVLVL